MQRLKLTSYLGAITLTIVLTLLASILMIAVLTTAEPAMSAETPVLQSLDSEIQYPISMTNQSPAPAVQNTATSTVYVPLILRNDLPLPAFGVQFAPYYEENEDRYAAVVEHDLEYLQRAGFSSIRTHVWWSKIEPENTSPDNYNWSKYDQRLQDYRDYGLDPVIGIVAYPDWATEYGCGGGLLDGMASEWREFVHALAERYSDDIQVWEIGNEVDGETEVDPEEDGERPPGWGHNEPTAPVGGCWGDIAGEYVEFLRIAYEEIKAVDPDATVMLGGLAYAEFERWFIRDFFDNFLEQGGGEYTDVIGFHWFKTFQPWQTAGEKAQELKEIMAAHDVDKPMWLTETYIPDRILDHDNRGVRLEFITQELPRTLGNGQIGRVYWYGVVDAPEGQSDIDRGLVTRDHQPKPGLKVFEIMTGYVHGLPSVENLSGVEAYRFSQPWEGEESWVMWSNTDDTHTVTLSTFSDSVTAIRIELGDIYETTRPVPVNIDNDGEEVRIPVGPETVFVRIKEESP